MLEGTGLAWVKLDTDPPAISKYMCPYCDYINEKPEEECPNCGRDMRTAKEPPIGIMPEYIWKRKRYGALCSAIGRYILAGMVPFPEWVEEGRRLLKEIEEPPEAHTEKGDTQYG